MREEKNRENRNGGYRVFGYLGTAAPGLTIRIQ
jgi:hypothetical protein